MEAASLDRNTSATIIHGLTNPVFRGFPSFMKIHDYWYKVQAEKPPRTSFYGADINGA